jgi:hypothetical protein
VLASTAAAATGVETPFSSSASLGFFEEMAPPPEAFALEFFATGAVGAGVLAPAAWDWRMASFCAFVMATPGFKLTSGVRLVSRGFLKPSALSHAHITHAQVIEHL